MHLGWITNNTEVVGGLYFVNDCHSTRHRTYGVCNSWEGITCAIHVGKIQLALRWVHMGLVSMGKHTILVTGHNGKSYSSGKTMYQKGEK